MISYRLLSERFGTIEIPHQALLHEAPELASLTVLCCALQAAVTALLAAYPELDVHRWDPAASRRLLLTHAVVAGADALLRNLAAYQGATDNELIDRLPF